MREQVSILNHLTYHYTEPIRDPVWKDIYLAKPFKTIVQTGEFQKLNKIKQLSLTHKVYPGATHTRLSHSIGVFHLAKRMIHSFVSMNQCDMLTLEGVKAFLAASLLHDLGHFPFTHSLKELPLKEHEVLTSELVNSSPLRQIISNDLGTDPEMVGKIVDLSFPAEDKELTFYHRLLSGVLDPDKLDYLNRDAYFCGVPYGIQDTDYVIAKIQAHESYGIALHEQGISAVENILFSKYLMYKNVYWHKTVRIMTAMIKKAIFLAMENEQLKAGDLYGLDDESFFNKFGDCQDYPFKLIHDVANRRLYKSVLELAFDEGNPDYVKLSDLSYRSSIEKRIYAVLMKTADNQHQDDSVIIDIPEKISFELDLPIIKDQRILAFSEADSVFTAPIIDDFTKTIRKIRLFVPAYLSEKTVTADDFNQWIQS